VKIATLYNNTAIFHQAFVENVTKTIQDSTFNIADV